MATLPEQMNIERDFGFSKKVVVSDTTGSRNIYMSVDKNAGFSRAQNLTLQLCAPDAPLPVLFDISEPKQGNSSRWGLDIEVPIDTALYTFLEGLNRKAREEVASRATECFPSLKVERMSDDQINMCMYPVFRPAEYGSMTGRLRVKVVMPATEEELSRMSKQEADRRQHECTKVYQVDRWEAPTSETPNGVFEHTECDASILKSGCKVMPIVGTTGIWMNKSNCGLSFLCSSICVWKAPETSGVGMFNLGGVKPGGIKRKRMIGEDLGEATYLPYDPDPDNDGDM